MHTSFQVCANLQSLAHTHPAAPSSINDVQVRDAMSHIWHALLDDPKASVTQNVDGEDISISSGQLISTPPVVASHGLVRWPVAVHSGLPACLTWLTVPICLGPTVLLAAAIMRGLLADMGGAQWRVREAASLAMADLLQGRRWAELQPTFEELWGMTLR
jgi:hypothetical protein